MRLAIALSATIAARLLTGHLASAGHSYERAEILKWLSTHTTSPLTREVLAHSFLTPNRTLSKAIEEWRE